MGVVARPAGPQLDLEEADVMDHGGRDAGDDQQDRGCEQQKGADVVEEAHGEGSRLTELVRSGVGVGGGGSVHGSIVGVWLGE